MTATATADPTLPELPAGWTARVPRLDDVPALIALRRADQLPWTGSDAVDEVGLEAEIVGTASWSRRQVVAVDADDVPRGWVSMQDRAAGRAIVWGWIDRTLDDPGVIADPLYAWVEEQAIAVAQLRGIDETRLDESPFGGDEAQREWLVRAGYTKRRTWMHMTRPVQPEEAVTHAQPRAGVVIRRVAKHDNGLPVAADLWTVHQMLEESFEDHFNSYRESFPEFVQRLREDPGHRWDHWWLAYVGPEGGPEDGMEGDEIPAGALVCSVLAKNADGKEGSYVEYIGVNREARGRGVAKSLLNRAIADAAERGRDRVGLEVDDDSPTKADRLYFSMGWVTDYVTDSWFKDLRVP
ncbi:MAG: GNAT family N-acetyltransferase, partial [Marmoricola sp.]